jgi:formylmethanofuran dehydrogenase subunit B
VIVIDDRPTATARSADLVVGLPADRDAELVAVLRLLVRRPGTDPEPLARGVGLEPAAFSGLATRLTGARYGALFFESRTNEERGARVGWEAVATLVRYLNEVSRFVLLGLESGWNPSGAESALTWQAGFPQGVDFGPGFPAPLDESGTLDEILNARETDAVVAVADPFPEDLSEPARAFLGTIPTVIIAPVATRRPGGRPSVALASATCGIDVEGTVTRVDGVVVPLRPLREGRFPSDRAWLKELSKRLGVETAPV